MIPSSPALCSDQSVLTPQTSAVFGCPVPARRKAISATQGQLLTIDWPFVDPDGRPVDLTGCLGATPPYTGSVQIMSRETLLLPGCTDPIITVTGTIVDVATGQASFAMPLNATQKAGIHMCEAAVFNAGGQLLFANQFYLIVNRGLFGADPAQVSGLPSIAEIRLAIHDSDGADNPILEDVQFDLAEIAAAIEMPILYWNESRPPIYNTYTTSTFPYRYHWMRGIVSRLYEIAAHYYRRNRLLFQAQGGVGVDDLNKAKEYEAKSQELWQEYKEWVLKTKVGLNSQGAVQTSGFGGIAW